MLQIRFIRKIRTISFIYMGTFLATSHIDAAPVLANPSATTEKRVTSLLKSMTTEEKLTLIASQLAMEADTKPEGSLGSAAYVPPVKRLGIPALQITDGCLGIANPANIRPGDGATSLPGGEAVSGTFDEALIHDGGAMIGAEARHRGFNIVLAGGMNLVRDPRGGRSFEYLGEDPILSGNMAAALVQGIQSQHVISTIKHFALNSYETGRMKSSVNISLTAMHESDLLAFQIAVQHAQPGSIMCAYNKVNGVYACQNPYLLTNVLRSQWHYNGFVMSDWGAVHNGKAATEAGLDQESAYILDPKPRFIDFMKKRVNTRRGMQLLDEKVSHILYAMFATGLFDDQTRPEEELSDIAAHMAIARHIEEEGAVLLRNTDKTLPISEMNGTILVIGGYADKGVLAGGSPSTVIPRGGSAVHDPISGQRTEDMPHLIIYDPNAPVDALRKALPDARVIYDDGSDPQRAGTLARTASHVIVFATKWQGESLDAANLNLDPTVNILIDRVASENHHVIVILETANPVIMPWIDKVGAILEAWYPGSSGGDAIASLLTGRVNPSGRTTISWPNSLADLPRPNLPGSGQHAGSLPSLKNNVAFPLNYNFNIEGANVGYRWYAAKAIRPLFPFGFGLSYTEFSHDKLSVSQRGDMLVAHVTLRNTGPLAGDNIVQIYARAPDHEPLRLAGYQRVPLAPGEQKEVDITLSPYAVSHYDAAHKVWVRKPGRYSFIFAQNAEDKSGPSTNVQIAAR